MVLRCGSPSRRRQIAANTLPSVTIIGAYLFCLSYSLNPERTTEQGAHLERGLQVPVPSCGRSHPCQVSPGPRDRAGSPGEEQALPAHLLRSLHLRKKAAPHPPGRPTAELGAPHPCPMTLGEALLLPGLLGLCQLWDSLRGFRGSEPLPHCLLSITSVGRTMAGALPYPDQCQLVGLHSAHHPKVAHGGHKRLPCQQGLQGDQAAAQHPQDGWVVMEFLRKFSRLLGPLPFLWGEARRVTGPGRACPQHPGGGGGGRYLGCCLVPVFPLLALLCLLLVLLPSPFLGSQGVVNGSWRHKPGDDLGDSEAALSRQRPSGGWLGACWEGADQGARPPVPRQKTGPGEGATW